MKKRAELCQYCMNAGEVQIQPELGGPVEMAPCPACHPIEAPAPGVAARALEAAVKAVKDFKTTLTKGKVA